MTGVGLNRSLALLALINAIVVAALLTSALLAGISQEPFQIARLPDLTVARLLLNPTGLRLNVGLDNLFIVTYVAFAVLLALRLQSVIAPMHVAIALGAMLLTALLDAVENHHILIMLYSAEQKLPLSVGETQLQMIASNVKFQANYTALALFAFGFHRLGGLGKLIAWGVWLLYVPLGMAIFMTPVDLSRPLVISRTLFFIAAFVATALLFRRSPQNAG